MNTTHGAVKREIKLAIVHIETAIETLIARGKPEDNQAVEELRKTLEKLKSVLDKLG